MDTFDQRIRQKEEIVELDQAKVSKIRRALLCGRFLWEKITFEGVHHFKQTINQKQMNARSNLESSHIESKQSFKR